MTTIWPIHINVSALAFSHAGSFGSGYIGVLGLGYILARSVILQVGLKYVWYPQPSSACPLTYRAINDKRLRIGKDFVSSGVILLCRLELVRGRGLDSRLREAYCDFVSWCKDNKKSTNIRGFSASGFKMGQILA